MVKLRYNGLKQSRVKLLRTIKYINELINRLMKFIYVINIINMIIFMKKFHFS